MVGVPGLAADLFEVVAGHPQAPEHQRYKSSPALPRSRRQAPDEFIRIRDAQSEAVEETFFDQRQQEKEPDAEADVQIGEVHEADDGEVEADIDRRKGVDGLDGVVPGDLWEEVEEVAGDIPADYKERNCRTQPEDLVAQNSRQATVGIGDQGLGYFHQWVGQPFALDPLSAQNDDDAEADEEQGEYKAQPPEKRRSPGMQEGAPGDRFAEGQAFEKPGHRLSLVGGQKPGGKVGQDIGAPLVFGRGEVVGCGGDGEEIAGQKDRDADDGQVHGDHGDQLGRMKGPGRIDFFEQGVEKDEAEKEKAYTAGKEGPGKFGRTESPDRMRCSETDQDDHGTAGD